MKNLIAWLSIITIVSMYGWVGAQSAVAEPSIDIWTAAWQGNLEAIKQHLAAGTDINANNKTLAGDVTYSVDDRSLLAEYCKKGVR